MSHQYRKIAFETQGSYGSTTKEFLYIHYNATMDIVTAYDERGNLDVHILKKID